MKLSGAFAESETGQADQLPIDSGRSPLTGGDQ
jgi:hypothetical protein